MRARFSLRVTLLALEQLQNCPNSREVAHKFASKFSPQNKS